VKIEFFLLNFNGIWNFLPFFLLTIFENCHRVDSRWAKILYPSLIDKLQNFYRPKLFFQNFSKFIFANFLVVFHNGGN